MARGPSTLPRRAELAALAALFLFANAVSALLIVRLGDRFSARIDVTATLEHRLAGGSRQAVARATSAGPIELVVAAQMGALDTRARVAVGDVLDEMERVAEPLRITRIDTGSGAGMAEFNALMQRLLERDRALIDTYLEAVDTALATLEQLASYFESDFAAAFGSIAGGIEPGDAESQQLHEYFRSNASLAPAQAAELRRQLATAGAWREPAEGAPIPEADRAGAALADTLAPVATAMAQIAQATREVAQQESLGVDARAQVREAADTLDRWAARAAQSADQLARLKTPDLIRVGRAIRGAEAALIIGPQDMGVAAIDFDALFPPRAVIEAAGVGPASLRQRAEELITTGLRSLAEPVKPIVVFMHGEVSSPASAGMFRAVQDRLALRGIDTIEWATVLEEPSPDLSDIDPAGLRPVVYVVHNTDTLAGGRGQISGPERALRLGQAINRVAQSGAPLLLSLQRSTLPTFGDEDPTATVLAAFGLRAETGRPLLREGPQAARRTVETDHLLRAAAEHADGPAGAVARAVEGLATVFSWPVPIEEAEAPDGAVIDVEPLYTIGEDRVWGEADWIGLARVPAEQRSLVPNPPSPDSARDDTSGPWTIALAAQRRLPGSDRQRLIAVGSSGWYITQIVGAANEVDGRRALLFPGNGELFEAAVLWLAGQERLIARTAAAEAAPVVGVIGESQMRALRWILIAGLPLAVLALGAGARLLRR